MSGVGYTHSALTGLLLLIFALTAMQTAASHKAWITLPLSYWMMAYSAWLAAVVMLSAVPNTSLLTAWALAGLPITYLAWANLSNADAIWLRLRTILWLAGVSMACWAIWQVMYHIGNGQAVGPLVDRNAFAALINLLWFPAAYLFLVASTSAKRWLPLLLGAGLLVMSAGLFATESRGGIGTWMLLLPILLWAGHRYSPSKRQVWIIPVIALAGYLVSTQLAGTNFADRTYDLAQDPSTSARLLIWKSTIQMMLAHPFTGTGWGTFTNYYPAYRSLKENTTSGLFAHNDYLQLITEGGIPALLLQLGILLGLLLQLKRSLQRSNDQTGLESVALSLGALALFIHATVNFIFYFAFMNILAGLYLARTAQLTASIKRITLPDLEQISRPIKYLLTGFVTLLLAMPLLLHLTAQYCLIGSQPGLKALNVIAPKITAYDIAKLISALRPQEGIAQEGMLEIAEQWLKNNKNINDESFVKHELLNEALRRFDYVRAQTANNPDIGVRETRILLENHKSLGDDIAYLKAHHVLRDNLKANPYHAYSMIELARLQAAEGHKIDAFYTLQHAEHNVLNFRDQLLIKVEILRQIAAPHVIPELDEIEKQLSAIRPETELELPHDFYKNTNIKLNAIAARQSATQ